MENISEQVGKDTKEFFVPVEFGYTRDIERSPLPLVLQTPSKSFSITHYQEWCEG
jgi:hypothetical protein